MTDYLVGEVTEEYAEGLLSRREALRRLGLLGVALPGAAALLAACGGDDESAPEPAADPSVPTPPQATAPPGENVGKLITFAADGVEHRAAFAAPAGNATGALLVVHENKGLTTHFFELVGRLASKGYAAICPDLLSREGPDGTAGFDDQAAATAALSAMPAEQLAGDLKAAADELLGRTKGAKLGVLGFCFGGGMAWNLLQAGLTQDKRLAAAIPFYGPAPASPDFTGSQAAVLAMYAGLDDRVNATRDAAEAALKAAKLEYEIKTWDGVDHAFFNDTGPRYNAAAAGAAQAQALAWFAAHLS